MKGIWRGIVGVSALVGVGIVMISASAGAMSFSSTDYTIDAAVLNNVGGYTSSSNYQLTSSGGEAAVGNGASGSYKLAAGYVAQVITPSITLKTQPSGLIGYYPLDEDSGTVAHDDSANANLGTFSPHSPVWTSSGKIGDALTFTGANDTAIDLNDPSQLQASTVTIEAWVKTTDTSDGMMIVGKQDAWGMRLTYQGGAQYGTIYDPTANANVCTGTTNVGDGNWHQLVVTIQSGVTNGTKLYVDGALQATCTVTVVNQASDAFIGTYNGSYNYTFTGTIDQVKFFNRVLNAQEVAAEYAAQNAGVETGLTLQTVTPGASNTSNFNVITTTSGSSYTLAISENANLTSGSNTIPGVSGSIASPVAWSEGTTKGLGFTLTSTNATAIPASWNSGNSYAALPLTPTSFYTRTGTQSSGADILGVQLRLDTATTQPSGSYSNTMTITGTASP